MRDRKIAYGGRGLPSRSRSIRSYSNGFGIDHVVSEALKGSCWSAGVTAGHPAVTELRYFDHKPLDCTLEEK